MSSEVLQARARVANSHRKNVNATPEERASARRDLAAANIAAYVRKVLSEAPKLTDAQAQRIAALLLAGGDA